MEPVSNYTAKLALAVVSCPESLLPLQMFFVCLDLGPRRHSSALVPRLHILHKYSTSISENVHLALMELD